MTEIRFKIWCKWKRVRQANIYFSKLILNHSIMFYIFTSSFIVEVVCVSLCRADLLLEMNWGSGIYAVLKFSVLHEIMILLFFNLKAYCQIKLQVWYYRNINCVLEEPTKKFQVNLSIFYYVLFFLILIDNILSVFF